MYKLPYPASPPLHRHHAAAWAMHETPRSAESTGMWCANGAVATSKTLEMNQEKRASSGKKLLKMIWFNNNLDFRCNKEWIRFKQQKRDWICQSSNWNLTSKASFLMSSTSHSGRKKKLGIQVTKIETKNRGVKPKGPKVTSMIQ